MFRAFLACLLLTACSPSAKYISVIVLETNCHEFDGALFVQPDGVIHIEYDPGLANGIAKSIPKEKGIRVIDGPCRESRQDPIIPKDPKEPKPTENQGVI